MYKNEFIKSIRYFDYLNELDNLINEILYSKDGYISLESKNAIDNYQAYLIKFENEANKISQNLSFANIQDIILDKKKLLKKKMDEHFSKEIKEWALDVYENLIENCLFNISQNKNNENILKENYSKGIEAINWIGIINNYDDKEKNALVEKFKKDIKNNPNLQNEPLLIDKEVITDENTFFEIWNSILDNPEKFKNFNANEYINKLNQKDINLFARYKTSLETFKKTAILDEIKLIKSAFKILNLSDKKDIYKFVNEIEDELNYFYSINKKITQEDKVNIIKKRMKIYKDSQKKSLNYFKTLLCS